MASSLTKPGLLLLMAVVSHASPTPGQESVRLTSRVECDSCDVELTRLVTLSGSDEAPIGRATDLVTRDSRARYFVPNRLGMGEVYVYDASGAHVATFGRRGAGPGEYRAITHIMITAGDTIHILDNANDRRTVLSPEFEVVRTQRFEASVRTLPTETVRLNDGRLVAASDIRTQDRVGLPLHLIGPDDRIVRSFGADEETAYPENTYPSSRAVTATPEGLIWSAKRTAYVLELWDISGRKHLEIVREADWFEPWVRDKPLAPDAPPEPWTNAIHADDRGRLWVLCQVTNPQFAEGLVRKVHESGTRYEIDDWDAVYDTVIEVIDVKRRRLLVSRRVSQLLTNFVDGDLLGYRVDNDGVPQIDIWRVRF